MRFEDMREYLWDSWAEFRPFRLKLKDGRVFDIRHPNHALVAEALIIVGIPPKDEPDSIYSDRTQWVRYHELESVERLPDSDRIPDERIYSAVVDTRKGGTMRFEDLREYAWRRADFRPFRLRLKDGRTFDIRHPNHTLVAEALVIVGIPSKDEPDSMYRDRTEWVRYHQIESVELLPDSVRIPD